MSCYELYCVIQSISTLSYFNSFAKETSLHLLHHPFTLYLNIYERRSCRKSKKRLSHALILN